MRDALHRRGAGPDDADPLVGQAGHQAARRVASGVLVVPAAGVERMALKGLDSRDARQFRPVEGTRAHSDELRPHLVAAIRADDPPLRRVIPVERRDLG